MTKRITHIAKPLLPATLTLSALMSMAACGSSAAKPSAAPAVANTTAVSAPSTGQAPSPASQTSASNPAQTSTQNQAPAAPATTAGKTAKPTSKPSAATSDAGSSLPGDCAVAHLKGTVTNLTRPINHVMITVTNTGSTTCNLYYYPLLNLDADQQSVTQAIEDSKPQAVVTIAPGESAYAAIGTSAGDGSGGTPRLEKQATVFLEARDQSGSLPGSMTLALPAGTYVDDKAFVTYWQSDLQSAAAW